MILLHLKSTGFGVIPVTLKVQGKSFCKTLLALKFFEKVFWKTLFTLDIVTKLQSFIPFRVHKVFPKKELRRAFKIERDDING